MVATAWFDSKPFIFLSTNLNLVALGPVTCKHWVNGSDEDFDTNPQQLEYSQNMKGGDVVDNMRRDYTCQYH